MCIDSVRKWCLTAALTAALGGAAPAATFFQNPSFELNYNPSFPHYGPVDLWGAQGGTGINEAGGPFHNSSTQIPDTARAAFIQGNGSLRQTVSGLTVGQTYWLQFFYDARNCCGGTVDLTVRYAGTQIDRIANVRATPTLPNRNTYYARTVVFTPTVDTGEMEFVTTAVGDASLVLDGVSLVARAAGDVEVLNPSFEASGDLGGDGKFPSGQNLAGWVIGGANLVGISGPLSTVALPAIPTDQDHAVFLQDQSQIAQNLAGLIPGTNYQVTFSYAQRAFDECRLKVTVGDAVLFDAPVPDPDPAQPFLTFSGEFIAADASAPLVIAQTMAGDRIVFIDNIRVSGATAVPLDCLKFAPNAVEIAPEMTTRITLTVDARATAGVPRTIRLRSPNQSVARLVGQDDAGELAVPFAVGETTKTFDVVGVGRGRVRIEIADAAGQCANEDVSVQVVTSFVRNSSFESDGVPAGVGYGPVGSWTSTGGVGLNGDAGPFHDNGLIPDRRQVAFIQGPGSLSQVIRGLTPGQSYWLQYFYNARNCCGGSVDLTVKFAGATLAVHESVAAVGAGAAYAFNNVAFTPADEFGALEFSTVTEGDASLLLDSIAIVRRDPSDIVVRNPSFEGTGSPVGVGYLQPSQIGGWVASGGGYGINRDGEGPFSDNGDAPDQDTVLLMQGGQSFSQNITGLTAGQTYTLIYHINARNCCTPGPTRHTVSFAGQELVSAEVTPVGGANPYQTVYAVFTATTTEGELRFTHAPPDGDRTLLLDDVRICAGNCQPRPRLRISHVAGPPASVRLAWPSAYSTYILQCATDPVRGVWDEVFLPVQIEGDENVIYDNPAANARKFYRLILNP